MSFDAVCDASAVIALLLDAGPAGTWAAKQLSGARLLAPSLVMFETSNIIRRHQLAGLVGTDQRRRPTQTCSTSRSNNGPTT